ncbi:hypothetical protein BDR22DRAFT_817494 [Usnea florida]
MALLFLAISIIRHAFRQRQVSIAHAAPQETHVPQTATVSAAPVMCTEEDVLISTGMPTDAVRAAETVLNISSALTVLNTDPDNVAAAIGSFSNIMPCPINNGSYTQIFCCSETAGSQAAAAGCCDTAAFNLNNHISISSWLSRPSEANAPSQNSQSRSANVSSSETPSTSTKLPSNPSGVTAFTSLTSTLSVVATPLPEHSPPPKKVVDIGTAIGVPLGVLLISGLTGLLVHERRLRMKAQKAVIDTLAACHQSRGAKTPTGGYMLQDSVRPQEMGCTEL